MDGVKLKTKGSWKKTDVYLHQANIRKIKKKLDKYGTEGVLLLSNNTPRDSGLTADSWNYEIHYGHGVAEVIWTNSNMAEEAMPVALLIQYGHGTRDGGYVKGIDYINPALAPVFKEMADAVWKEMTK